jgi:hypothetical protein
MLGDQNLYHPLDDIIKGWVLVNKGISQSQVSSENRVFLPLPILQEPKLKKSYLLSFFLRRKMNQLI